MPDFPGRLRTPRLAAAPATPAQGEMYFDTATSKLYWWSGTAWVDATGGAGSPEVYIGTDPPSPRVAQTIWIDTDAVGAYTQAALVTSLPASPVDGQEVYFLADATNGVVWHLRYRSGSASAYKWEVVGGSPLAAEAVGSVSTASTAMVSLSGGPSLTLPLAGDYEFTWGSLGTNGSGPTIHGIALGATAANDALSARGGGVGGAQISGINVATRTIAAAATLIESKYRTTAGTGNWEMRHLRARPVRVG